jgi:hypothetical protein
MTEIDRQYVKRGLWTNYDKGPVIGQTITTDTRTGSFVVALLAVLSTLGEYVVQAFLMELTITRSGPCLASSHVPHTSSSSEWSSFGRIVSPTASFAAHSTLAKYCGCRYYQIVVVMERECFVQAPVPAVAHPGFSCDPVHRQCYCSQYIFVAGRVRWECSGAGQQSVLRMGQR